MVYAVFKEASAHACYGCKTAGNVEVLTEALAVWIPTGGLAVDPKQLCKLLTGIITTLTTNWGFPASNRVENKNRKDPGHRASYCLVESIDISNAVELAVLYFGGCTPLVLRGGINCVEEGCGARTRGVTDMGEQVRELFNWARRRKILAAVFVAFTLTVGILIGSVVSGRVSAMKSLGFPGTTATALAVPDPVPSSSSFASIVNRVEPAVVNIATTQVLERKKGPRTRRAQPNDQDDPLQDFFARSFGGRPDGR